MRTVRELIVGLALLIGVVAILTHMQTSATSGTSAQPGCQATVVATEGSPPPGTPTLDPQRLCDALGQAQATADCMADWQPPNPARVNVRELCVETQRRGCGTPGQDCNTIPVDQEYYYHH